MINLLIDAYNNDAVRFAAWHTLEVLHLANIVADTLFHFGFHVWEDYSISR